MEKVISFLHGLYPLPAGMEADLESVLNYRRIRKNEILHPEGSIPRYAWYLQKGLVRCYYERDHREVTMWFMEENNVIILFKALSGQKKSLFHVQALEDCEVYSVHYQDLQLLLRKYPEALILHKLLFEQYSHLKDLKIRATSGLAPKERYRYFQKHFPYLTGRLKLEHTASYLDLSLRTLNRVRGK